MHVSTQSEYLSEDITVAMTIFQKMFHKCSAVHISTECNVLFFFPIY